MSKPIVHEGHVPRVKFQVTDENIRDAIKENSRHCMIADAIKNQLPGVRNISVDMMHIRWSDPATGWRYIYQTPKPAQESLIDFDMGYLIEPFSFQVRSGLATPMIRGSGKNKKRAHSVRENKIVKVTDKTIVHSVKRDSVPMWAKEEPLGSKPVKMSAQKDHKGRPIPMGRPKEWHPSHNTLRHFGFRGFTEGYIKKQV